MKVYGVLPAAGKGKRFGTELPKQYQLLAGKPVLEHSISRLLASFDLSGFWVALGAEDIHWDSIDPQVRSAVHRVDGGTERADSVRLAIDAIPNASADDWVMVHDAVRPLVSSKLVGELLHSLDKNEAGAILALPVFDTVKLATNENTVSKTLDRTNLWTAQTPQVFRYGMLKEALETTAGDTSITDEASAMEACGHRVRLYEGHRNNMKITCREDLLLAEQLINLEVNS